ncbi:MAG: HAMP domain-containing histidine kinase [Deltaproteobacteria bacterium]|nr:HAMP domain-containing histidine kinase [Deltaproteobacteria bacterium]MBW2144310.1 HAMP domain-containing histidine kinase [Deltaproteobacteria bacterium]
MDNTQKHEKDALTRRERIKIDFLVHELKSPLAVIEVGISSLLRRTERYGPLTKKQEKVLRRALRNTRVTQTLVDDTLELGRSRDGVSKLTNCRLSNLILQVLVEVLDLAEANTSEKIKICADLPRLRETLLEIGIALFIDEGLWCQQVCLDEVKIKQIFRNLVSNALKYRKSRVELELEEKGGHLFFSVKDDGKGISPIFHEKIFECYFQPNDTTDINGFGVRGHGLGLASVMVLLEDMDGELFLESDEGKGAKFMVKVPLVKQDL